MKRHTILCSLLLAAVMAAPLFAQENVPPPAKAFASAPEIAFDSVPNFLKLPTRPLPGRRHRRRAQLQRRRFCIHARR